MTLPVLIVMVSGDFPATYGHEYNWLILLALFAVGAAARHAFNLENYGQGGKWPLLGGALAGLIAISLIVSPINLSGGDSMAAEEDPEIAAMFQQVRLTITKHCTNCHSESPTHEAFEQPPKGVVFDTPRMIQLRAPLIKKTTVDEDLMPLGDETEMTDAERSLLRDWIAKGARIR